ncbi:MAG: hypothetical protein SF028_03945 [Candidatus Sumerlaeia bacterium]|nr:hypothetical protein [Candidatus Sumerlaeia bacterium]
MFDTVKKTGNGAMAHAALNGPLTAEEVWLGFKPMDFREGGDILKVTEAYLKEDRREVMVRALTVERGIRRTFYFRVAQKEASLSLTVDSFGSPEQTPGLRRLLALCAWVILQSDHRMELGNSDVSDLVRAPEAT